MALLRAPMVGRDEELAVLRSVVSGARAGHCCAVVIRGEAGIGKTRLLGELLQDLEVGAGTDELLVLRGGCSTADRREVPWGPFLDIVRDLRRSLGTQDFMELAGPRVVDLAPLDPGLPVARSLVEWPDESRMCRVLSGLLLDAAAHRPTLLVVEDVHWADEGSRRVLEYLVRSLRTEPLALLLTVRTEEPADDSTSALVQQLMRTGSTRSIELQRLDRELVAEQFGHLCAQVPLPDVRDSELLEQVVALSAGVPLLVEEVASALDSEGDLHTLSQLSGDLHGHRMARLPPDARHVVETAAVAMSAPQAEALLVACHLPGAAFDRALATAVDAGVLQWRRPRVEFRHAVLREATLARLLPHRERELHHRWAAVLEPDVDGVEAAVAVARHRIVAGVPSAALSGCARAADLARSASGFAVQLEMLGQVARLWPRVEDAEELAERDLVDVYAQAAQAALYARADTTEAQRLAQRALALLTPGSTPDRRAWLDLMLLWCRYSRSEHIPIDECLDAVDRIPSEPPTRERVRACGTAAAWLLQAGRPSDAEPYAQEAARSAHHLGLAALEVEAAGKVSQVHLHQGRYEQAVRSATQACRIAEATGDLVVRADSLEILLSVLWHVGEPADALEVCRDVVELFGGDRPGPMPSRWGMNLTNLAELLIEQGHWVEAQRALDQVLAVPGMRARVTDFACRLNRHLRVWRDGPDPDYVPGEELWITDVGLDTMDMQDLVPSRYTNADISSHHRDLIHARAEVRGPLADRRTAQLPEAMYNLLGVAARTEADAKSDGWPDPDPDAGVWVITQIEVLLSLMKPTSLLQQAQHAHIRADVALWSGNTDPATWAHVVDRWRRVPHPRPLALALLRLGCAAAMTGDQRSARDALAEALQIAHTLGARPLQDSIHAQARNRGLRIGTSAGAHTGTDSSPLTTRELEVLCLVADGATNAEVAKLLFISPKTVSVHVSHILDKLGVTSRTAAAATARKAGLLPTQATRHDARIGGTDR